MLGDSQDVYGDEEVVEGYEGFIVGYCYSDRGQFQLVELDVQLLRFFFVSIIEIIVSFFKLVVVDIFQVGDVRVVFRGIVRYRVVGQDQ